MSLRDRVKGLAFNAFLSDGANRIRRGLHETRRRVKREPQRIEFYFQVDDPYSHLLAQRLPALMQTYDVDCELIVVSAPAADTAPEPTLRASYSIKDARDLAAYYKLDFPDGPSRVDESSVVRANQVMVIDRPVGDQLRAAIAVGNALWANDKDALAKAMGTFGSEASGNVKPVLAENYARLRKRGHYWGGMLHFAGEWYWGVDRLHYLETVLGGGEVMLDKRSEAERAPALLTKEPGERLAVDFYHSLRSPYSYLALTRALALADSFDIDLNIKPVLPMVMRGLQVPLVKRLYIVRDAKREADRLGIAFGNICDPLGDGIGRCLAIFAHAQTQGKGGEFLLSVGRGAWSEALNIANDTDLQTIVERAGLSWTDAQTAMDDDSYEKAAADNRDELNVAGMWGVPAFRAGTFTTWGQDRIELLEDRLRRHFAAG